MDVPGSLVFGWRFKIETLFSGLYFSQIIVSSDVGNRLDVGGRDVGRADSDQNRFRASESNSRCAQLINSRYIKTHPCM